MVFTCWDDSPNPASEGRKRPVFPFMLSPFILSPAVESKRETIQVGEFSSNAVKTCRTTEKENENDDIEIEIERDRESVGN